MELLSQTDHSTIHTCRDWSFCCGLAKHQTPVATPGFTAPEQMDGKAGNESDWFGLASSLAFLAIGDGQVYVPFGDNLSLRNLHINHGYSFKLCYRLNNGIDEFNGSEGQLILELLTTRAIIAIEYEPASAPVLRFAKEVAGYQVLEIQSGSHVVIGNRRWFVLPQDREELTNELTHTLNLPWNAALSGQNLLSAIEPSNPDLASALSA